MYFGTSHKINKINAECPNTDHARVDVVNRFMYLGVMLDPKLSFTEHVTYLIKKITPKPKTLSRIRCHIGTNTALFLYNSLIAPLFIYNDYIYDSMGIGMKEELFLHGIGDAYKLQVIENSCIRNCLKSLLRRRWAGGTFYVAHISTHQASPITAMHATVNYTILGIQT